MANEFAGGVAVAVIPVGGMLNAAAGEDAIAGAGVDTIKLAIAGADAIIGVGAKVAGPGATVAVAAAESPFGTGGVFEGAFAFAFNTTSELGVMATAVLDANHSSGLGSELS